MHCFRGCQTNRLATSLLILDCSLPSRSVVTAVEAVAMTKGSGSGKIVTSNFHLRRRLAEG